MVTQLEVHQAEQRYIELKRQLEAEKAPLDPQQVRAAMRVAEHNFTILAKLLWDLCPELFEKHGVDQLVSE